MKQKKIHFLDENKIEYNEIEFGNKKKKIDEDDFLLRTAARTIKRYSQCKEKIPFITEFLNRTLKPNLHNDDTFIGPFPLSYYSAVSAGIYKFSKKIEDIDFDTDSDEE